MSMKPSPEQEREQLSAQVRGLHHDLAEVAEERDRYREAIEKHRDALTGIDFYGRCEEDEELWAALDGDR